MNFYDMNSVSAFSRNFAINLLAHAVRNGVEFDDSLNVALNPTLFMELLLVSRVDRVQTDVNLGLYGLRWLGAFWHIDKNVEGAGTSKAIYYVRNGLSGRETFFYADDTALPSVM